MEENRIGEQSRGKTGNHRWRTAKKNTLSNLAYLDERRSARAGRCLDQHEMGWPAFSWKTFRRVREEVRGAPHRQVRAMREHRHGRDPGILESHRHPARRRSHRSR